MSAGRRTICRILTALLVAPGLVPAQSTRAQDLAAGKVLVASRDLNDPNFAETVVLLVRYEKEGVVGLVLNRRTRIPISRALDEIKGAKDRSDPIYAGGPVGRSRVMALVRSRTKVEDADHVFGDVYLLTRETALAKAMQSEAQAEAFHVYLGYAGWTPRQLEAEVGLGAWFIFSGDAAMVFAANPQPVWQRMIEKTEERVAWNRDAGIFNRR